MPSFERVLGGAVATKYEHDGGTGRLIGIRKMANGCNPIYI